MEHSCLRLAPLCQDWYSLVFRPSVSRRCPNARIDRNQWDLIILPRGVRDAHLWDSSKVKPAETYKTSSLPCDLVPTAGFAIHSLELQELVIMEINGRRKELDS